MPGKSFSKQIADKVDAMGSQETAQEPAATPSPTPAGPEGVPPEQGPQPQEIEFKKFTVPLRTDQLEALTDRLRDVSYHHRVDISKASVIRLALDRVLTELEENPEAVLRALYALEEKELEMNEDRRKYSVSRGLREYVNPES